MVSEDKNDKVRVELEVPKDQLRVDNVSDQSNDQSPQDDPERLHDKGKMTVGGYTVGDIAKTPFQPPEPKDPEQAKEKPAKTRPSMVSQSLIVVGIGFILLSLLFLAFDGTITAMLFVLGALAIGAGLVIPKASKKIT